MLAWWMSVVLCAAPAGSPPLAPAGKLHCRVVDAETGQPLACRVWIRSDDGQWFFPNSEAPEGSAVPYKKPSISDRSIVEMHTTVSAHPFAAELPPGRYTVVVERGKEYHAASRSVAIEPKDGEAEQTVKLVRWINLAERGWFSGDTHTHRTLEELPNVLLAEDLNVAFPLLDWVREAFIAPTARREKAFHDPGPDPIQVDATHWIFPRNTEYELFSVGRQPHPLGAFFVLNHQTPLDLGAPPVKPIAARAHREGALIELDKHNWPWSMAIVPVMPVDLYELANNHHWRTTFGIRDFGLPAADYMHVEKDAQGWTERGWTAFGFQNYYALLDCGFRLRPTAGTASGVHPVPLGFGRVYVHLDGPFDGRAWIQGLNAGRSFVTTGPMLFVTLDERDPGSHIEQAEGPPRAYRLRGTAVSAEPLEQIEVVVNGEIFRSIPPENRPTDRQAYESSIEARIPIDGSSWVAVRCFGRETDRVAVPKPGEPAVRRLRFAHTGPFFIDVPGRPLRPRRVEVDYLIHRVQAELDRSERLLPPPAVEEYREALRIYKKIAETARD